MKFMKLRTVASVMLSLLSISAYSQESASDRMMEFDDLATVWDEAMPLGNATIGSLVWQREDKLRISIDRVDLWDLRTHEEFSKDSLSFAWIYESVMNNNYKPVQQRYDFPYNGYPGPSKIPGAGLEVALDKLGEVENVSLNQTDAICTVTWKSGATLECFIHAVEPIGCFVFDGIPEDLDIELVPPVYDKVVEKWMKVQDQSRHSLAMLGYEQGDVVKEGDNKLVYTQKGWGDFSYSVAIKWERKGDKMYGVWSASSSLIDDEASDMVDKAMEDGMKAHKKSHAKWWADFYAKSSISIPDETIEYQYYNEIYKMGSIARENSYPISLQSIWTADNGKLPPWKGDYHHDLNTQLSYWPFYTGNYLTEGYGYLNTLWNQRDKNKEYTKDFFGVEGLNVPGVATLEGSPMGGWCQYSMGPTVSAWLSQHFYLHWKYSQDDDFLKNVGYPYLKDVATFLENFSVVENGVRKLPLSSSPEINDNSIDAWFKSMTNYDLAMMKFAFSAASEMAQKLGLSEEAANWTKVKSELPDYDLDEDGCFTFAKGAPYNSSHRHFSHAMAFHPLGLIDMSQGEESQRIIKATIDKLDKMGPDYWTGYSYSWLANMKARAFDGAGAAEALRIFADCFCLKTGFHANGDQTKSGKSKFTYRPFTLEGNMAYASGVQEMLLQSHTGVVRVFPAIPAEWKDASFKTLRAMGAFLVSAEMVAGKVKQIEVVSEKGGLFRLANPYDKDEVLEFDMHAGESLTLSERDLVLED